jgi:hypothetical protein
VHLVGFIIRMMTQCCVTDSFIHRYCAVHVAYWDEHCFFLIHIDSSNNDMSQCFIIKLKVYLLIADKDLNAVLLSQVQHSEWCVHLKSGKLRMMCSLIPLQNETDIFTSRSLRLRCPYAHLDIDA